MSNAAAPGERGDYAAKSADFLPRKAGPVEEIPEVPDHPGPIGILNPLGNEGTNF